MHYTFKLLGLHLDATLSWTIYINTMVSKASKRLYFLKQLRRACIPPQQLHSNLPSPWVCLPSLALFHHSCWSPSAGINPKTSSTYHFCHVKHCSAKRGLVIAHCLCILCMRGGNALFPNDFWKDLYHMFISAKWTEWIGEISCDAFFRPSVLPSVLLSVCTRYLDANILKTVWVRLGTNDVTWPRKVKVVT